MSDQLIYDIKIDECVGDSVSKHNYNLLSLDTTICNLSSLFFNNQNSYYSEFVDLSSNINTFNSFANVFFNPVKLNKATSATRSLSSYWNKHEITLTFPINIYEIGTFKQAKSYVDSTTTQASLTQYGLNLLNNRYPVANFLKGSIANVIFLLYSNIGRITTTRTQAFTITNRTFNVTNRKDDVHITGIKIIKYQINPSSQWQALAVL